MFQHKSLKEMGDEAQRRLWEKERQADKQAKLEADHHQEIESLKACGVTIPETEYTPGYYWAKHVSGIRDPEVVWMCMQGTIQIIGDDYSYDKNSFEILRKVEPTNAE